MFCSFSDIHERYNLSPMLHRVHHYIEMLIAIPTLGYLRL